MLDDYKNFVFSKPIMLFVTNSDGHPEARIITEMSDYISLYDEIRDGKIDPKIGDLTVDQQLWLALAKWSMFLKDRE